MPVEYFKAKQEIQDKVQELIGKQHPDLAVLSKSEIVVVFREKAAKAGGQVVLGSSKKAQPLMNALAEENFVFILELAQDEWTELTAVQQEALLDHLLCACRAEEDEKKEDGGTKFFVAKPDVQAFRDNVERYGMWFPKEKGDDGPDPVGDMFGDDKDAEAGEGS